MTAASGSPRSLGGPRDRDAEPDRLLAALDESQRAVATAPIGPVRVLAGAGTGKTRAITHRIAYGVASGLYPPESVLALTFTSKAAAELRHRLRGLGLPPVAARTFHAAALAQLRHFWPQVVGAQAPRLLKGKIGVIAEAAAGLGLDPSTPALRDIAAEIEWRKIRNITVDRYALLGRTPPAGLAPEQLAALMMRYETLKDRRRAMDFEDVLLATAGMLQQEPTVRDEVRSRYRVFVVDEFQDVSPVQYRLLELWLGRRRDVCVVGDPSQTIYTFSGADPSFLLDFDRAFPGATTVRLERNYRSTAPIVAVANALAHPLGGALQLRTDRTGAPVGIAAAPTPEAEADAVAAHVKELHRRGRRFAEIAVLVRIGSQIPFFERALADAGVPCVLRDAVPFFSRKDVAEVVVMLGVEAARPESGTPLTQRVVEVLRQTGWQPQPPPLAGAERDSWEARESLRRLADELPSSTPLRDFYRELLERKAGASEPQREAVVLSTIHAAKGLEWPVVHVAGIVEGLLPISYADTASAVAEERRLFYVATTRARDELWLSWHTSASGTSRHRSRFLDEIAGLDRAQVSRTEAVGVRERRAR